MDWFINAESTPHKLALMAIAIVLFVVVMGAILFAVDRPKKIPGWVVTVGFLGPAVLGLGFGLVYPGIRTIWGSLFNRNGAEFVGLDNYIAAFTEEQFQVVLRNTLAWVILVPVVATLVGPVLGLRVRGAQWAGLAAGAVGVALVVSADLGSGTASWWAYLLPLVAMASLVAATLVERRHPSEASVVDTLLLHATVALVVIGGFAMLTGQAVPPTTAVFWWTVAFVAVSPTLAAYGLYWYLVRRLGITVLNALLFCVAPTTAVAGALIFGEPLTPLTVAGLALCAAGVGVVITSEARGRRPCAVPARDLVS